jgi:hypothetical protein
MGNGPGGYHLYSWNGLDCIPGINKAKGKVEYIGQISSDSAAKAEGITILSDNAGKTLKLLIIFDGPERGSPLLFDLKT